MSLTTDLISNYETQDSIAMTSFDFLYTIIKPKASLYN